MQEHDIKRKLATIMVADIVGFSSLTANDEDWTIRSLGEFRIIVDEIIDRHDGRIFNTGGDSILAEFGSPVEAVRCAVDFQEAARSRNLLQPRDKQLRFRIGLNLGDVLVRGADLLGDGVNVAARLEGIAEPGGICVSGTVWDQVNGKLSIGYVDIGEQSVKNIPRPVRAYHLRVDGVIEEIGKPPPATSPAAVPVRIERGGRGLVVALIGAIMVIVILASGLAWQFWLKSAAPTPLTAAAVPSYAPPTIAAAPASAVAPSAPLPLKEALAARLASAVPSLSKKVREDQVFDYEMSRGHKAQAVSLKPAGTWRATGRSSTAEAQTGALEGCQIHYGQPCVLLAVDETMVPAPPDDKWPPQDMPRTRYSGDFDPAQIPNVTSARRDIFDIANYRSAGAPKAAAFHPWGRVFIVTNAANQRVAEEQALKACKDNPDRNGANSPCFLYAVANRVVLPLRLKEPLTPP
jgi:adenylate cyclase